MEHGEDLDSSLPRKEATAQGIDSVVAAQKPVRGSIAQRDDYLWSNKPDLRGQPLPASGHFLPGGHAVPRRPALHHVRYVHLIPLNAHALQDLGEELPRRTDKRPAGLIFYLPWGLADEHERCRSATLSEHHIGAGLAQATAAARKDAQTQIFKGWRETGQGRHLQAGAGNGNRTRDLRLGTPTLYQLSYARVRGNYTRVSPPGGPPRPAWAPPGGS